MQELIGKNCGTVIVAITTYVVQSEAIVRIKRCSKNNTVATFVLMIVGATWFWALNVNVFSTYATNNIWEIPFFFQVLLLSNLLVIEGVLGNDLSNIRKWLYMC